MEPVKNSGTLSETSCPRLLAYLHRTRFDGTLRISRGALLKLLYFQGGEIAMASSNDQGDHLAPILIRAGKLKPEQMDLARKSTKPGTSLARILVQMGFLTSGELFAGARQQLRQIVGSVMKMTDASYEIQGGFFPREITSLNVDTREMFLELVRDLSDRSFVLLEVGAPDTIYVPTKDAGNGDDALKLPRGWKEHVGRFSSPLAIHEFGQLSSLDDFSASKVVYGLSLFGCVAPQQNVESVEQTPSIEMVGAAAPVADPMPPVEPAGEEVSESIPEEAFPEPPRHADEPAEKAEVDPIPAFRERFHSVRPAEQLPDPGPEPTAPEIQISQPTRDTLGDSPGEAPDSLTGIDRVADGKPIRLEFKGPYAEKLPPVKPSRPWAAASILGGLCLLALTSYWFIFLRAPEAAQTETASAPAPPAQEVTPGETTGDNSTTGAVEGGAIPGTPDSSAAADAAQSVPPEAPPSETPPSPPVAEDTSGKAAAGQPDSGSPAAPSPEAVTASAAMPKGFRAARAQLDAGEHASSARSWAGAFGAEAARAFTIQIAIACQEETLGKAARRTSGSEPFFVLPFSLGGRPCYRLCWGLFDSLDAAQGSRSTVPSFFLAEGGQPVAVSLRKALPQEGR